MVAAGIAAVGTVVAVAVADIAAAAVGRAVVDLERVAGTPVVLVATADSTTGSVGEIAAIEAAGTRL